MAFYDQQRSYYFHDLWKRTATTWGGGPGYTWQRVDIAGGPKLDYPDFAKAETQGNIIRLGSYGQSGIARRWRWNGAAWVLEETRSTGDTGALSLSEQEQNEGAGQLFKAAGVAVLAAVLLGYV